MTRTWGCSCSVTIKWLAKRGAPHASRVHKLGLSEQRWSPGDWLAHFAEEERYLFPLFPRHIQRYLTKQHVVFRQQLREFGRVDMREMARHASIEDTYTALVSSR